MPPGAEKVNAVDHCYNREIASDSSQTLTKTAPELNHNPLEWAVLPRPSLPPTAEFSKVEYEVSHAIAYRDDPSNVLEKSVDAKNGYRGIIKLLQDPNDVPKLTTIILALRTCGNGSTLGKITSASSKHSQLIHFLLRLDPFSPKPFNQTSNEVDSEFYLHLADAHLNLLVALVSSNSVLLTPVMNALWRLIVSTDPITPNEVARIERAKDPMASSEMELKRNSFLRNSRLHGTLSKILHHIPKGRSEIYPLMASSFPFKLAPIERQVSYMKQCLTLVKYVPTIHQQFLELAMDKCLEIDVEIRLGENGKVEIERMEKENFNLDLEGITLEKNSEQKAEEEKLKISNGNKTEEDKVDEMAEKLDSLMYLSFEHLKSSSSSSTPRQLYRMILPAFDQIIITTHRCKFVQFVILFLCGLDHDFMDNSNPAGDGDEENMEENMIQTELSREFAAKLINLVLDPYRATVTRQSAACYLASFVSRATFVCAETACEAVSALLRFAEAYMTAFPTELSARNVRKATINNATSGDQRDRIDMHSLFYTVCQAAFYIMCFRGKECLNYYEEAKAYHLKVSNDGDAKSVEDDLMYGEIELIDISSTRWNRLCSHHLNPLRFCLESVRGEFLSLADAFKLLDDTLLRKSVAEDRKMTSGLFKKRLARRKSMGIRTAATMERKRIIGGVGGLGKGSNPLNSFFPFDPYLLRRSYSYVEPYYRDWASNSNKENNHVPNEIMTENAADISLMEDQEVVVSDKNDESSEEEETDDEEEDNAFEGQVYRNHSLQEFRTLVRNRSMSVASSVEDRQGELPSTDDTKLWVNELKRARAQSITDDCW